MFSCQDHNYFFLTLACHIWQMSLLLWEDVTRTFMFRIQCWPLTSTSNRLLSCLLVRPVTSACFDIGIPYLAHGSIYMRGCVKYIPDHDTTLTFDLKIKGFMTWFCVQASAFLSFDIAILCLARECITMVQRLAYIHELCMTLTFNLNIKILFSPLIWVWKDIFALWHRQTKFWHMRQHLMYILDLSMTLTFDLYVGGGDILSEFYSQFLSCFFSVCMHFQINIV